MINGCGSVKQGDFTPKQRMLNAYRGTPSDRFPVAPEFWYFYPARLLGVDETAVELAGMVDRGLDRLACDLVEDHPLHGDLRREHLQ